MGAFHCDVCQIDLTNNCLNNTNNKKIKMQNKKIKVNYGDKIIQTIINLLKLA